MTFIKRTILAVSILMTVCGQAQQRLKKSNSSKKSGYTITPVNIQNVKVTDAFWLPIIKKVQEKTIEYAIHKCEEEGRMDNFLIAGSKMEGTVKGQMPFDDTDVYKIIEGTSNTLISEPNPKLEILLDSLISIVKIGQEKDGYLTTWRTINPAKPPAPWVPVIEGKRWESLQISHELYNSGHLIEAAVVHYEATGKKNFLDIAIKNADMLVRTFGDRADQVHSVPGHQIVETGLVKLYQVTNNKAYLNLAKYFLDNRGNPKNHNLYGAYSQDDIPVIQQKEAVGHAVRAVYMYAGMTDIAALENDAAYGNAVNHLWTNMVNKKTYITGGIGAKHDGEAFGENYELPNLTAYNETCAAIGNVYWNHRLHNISGNSDYFDVIERSLYNGLISGLSLDGKKFFYPNALESDGVYKFNRGECTRQSWFDCSCCPTNLIRFIPSIPGLIYSKSKDVLYVNLYASNTAKITLDKTNLEISQQTNYPWDGKVALTVSPKKEIEFTIKLRIPSWARNQVLPGDLYSYATPSTAKTTVTINGKAFAYQEDKGYITITRKWKKREKIVLDFPMEVKQVVTNTKVEGNKGKVALEYGPIVYAIEEADNATNFDAITIGANDTFKVKKEENLLEGVNIIQTQKLKAIPYYSWSNRGVGKMKVWIDYKE
ncbi:glycoside hydrolase family 127 protein [Flavobacterium algoritolerans]|uniref:Glycoside hydrolase family 127 protein n=1 Tax=Flavobacterium algoritolerans TaxID=3041254 RepID=A0ABT6V7Y0_9FLAO|nr:glycoside hydrolase family 127 protein [Flavobacterium algoritolerans]MDI5894302.1 glycoside hydrolase family 127 protein [Flavobacterium algoritolerans]